MHEMKVSMQTYDFLGKIERDMFLAECNEFKLSYFTGKVAVLCIKYLQKQF